MNKTIKINISGTIFQIEEDAFEMLRDYLQAINTRLKNLPCKSGINFSGAGFYI
jgi:predicted nucleic acid-binding Zn ribbon protein